MRSLQFAILFIFLSAQAAAEQAVEYDWLTQGKVSGRLELVIHDEGERSAHFEFNDRGRGPDLDERYRVHWDGAAGNEDAVVQIIGNGPVATNQEHKESADWVRVKQSNIAQSK